MWKSRYEKEKRRVEELERELMLAQRRISYANGVGSDGATGVPESSLVSLPAQERSAAACLPQSPPSNPRSRSSSRSRGRGRSSGSNAGIGGSRGHLESPAEKMFAEQQLSFRVPPDDDHGGRGSDIFMSHAVSDDVVGDAGIVIDNIGAVNEVVQGQSPMSVEAPQQDEDAASITSSVASKMKKGAKLITSPIMKAKKSAKKVLR
mmetsp:Transcript_4400/g.12401  ORF Transcript_4400/g.12401 Transcript_4400/m.12401 type:complete len:206 (+) Transcript_4400:388-1005(+)